jgi:hypothetical protein
MLSMISRKNYLINLLSTKNIENIVDSNKLDHISINTLNYIAINPNSCTNDCYMYVNNNTYEPISYEDMENKIQNLIDVRLIHNVNNIEKHNNETLYKRIWWSNY